MLNLERGVVMVPPSNVAAVSLVGNVASVGATELSWLRLTAGTDNSFESSKFPTHESFTTVSSQVISSSVPSML